MKPLSLYLLFFVFLANTMIASVWAQPCVMDKDSMPMQSDVSMMGEIPCHDEQEDEPQNQNCEELCLFLNVLISQASIISSDVLSVPASKSIHILIENESINSIESLPLYRPPIILS